MTTINEEARRKHIEALREELQKIEEQYKEMFDKLEHKYEAERRYVEHLLEILMNAKTPEEIMKVTCFENIGYCCGLEKDCPMRNMVLEILNIPKEEYKEIKELFGVALVYPDKREKLKKFLRALIYGRP